MHLPLARLCVLGEEDKLSRCCEGAHAAARVGPPLRSRLPACRLSEAAARGLGLGGRTADFCSRCCHRPYRRCCHRPYRAVRAESAALSDGDYQGDESRFSPLVFLYNKLLLERPVACAHVESLAIHDLMACGDAAMHAFFHGRRRRALPLSFARAHLRRDAATLTRSVR